MAYLAASFVLRYDIKLSFVCDEDDRDITVVDSLRRVGYFLYKLLKLSNPVVRLLPGGTNDKPHNKDGLLDRSDDVVKIDLEEIPRENAAAVAHRMMMILIENRKASIGERLCFCLRRICIYRFNSTSTGKLQLS